jgi:hypothetical protein
MTNISDVNMIRIEYKRIREDLIRDIIIKLIESHFNDVVNKYIVTEQSSSNNESIEVNDEQ